MMFEEKELLLTCVGLIIAWNKVQDCRKAFLKTIFEGKVSLACRNVTDSTILKCLTHAGRGTASCRWGMLRAQ